MKDNTQAVISPVAEHTTMNFREKIKTVLTRKRIFWGVVLLLVAGFGISRLFFTGTGDDVETIEAVRGNVVEYVSETGKVVAVDDLDLFFETTGRVKSVLVKEGDAIQANQEIMRLDAGQLFIRRQDAVAALSSAQAQYDKALAGATSQEVRISEIAVGNAEDALRSAEETLEDTKASNVVSLDKAYSDLGGYSENVYLKSSTAMQTLQNEVFNTAGNLRYDITPSDALAVSEAGTAFQVASAAKIRMDGDIIALRTAVNVEVMDALAAGILADGKAVRDAVAKSNVLMQSAIPAAGLSQATFDARVAAVKASWVDINTSVNSAESQRALISSTKISNLSSENTASQRVTTAEGALRTAKEQLERLNAPLRDVDKAVYLASIASARANVSLVDRQISETILRSPVDGVIGSLDISVGELVMPSSRAASVISKTFRIESDVSELDIAKIVVGQEVRVTFDALEGQVFMGKVASVAPRETTAADLDIFYSVKIALDDMHAPLRSGMTADLDMNVGEKTDVITIPRRQVLSRAGTNYVKILADDGTIEERDVQVGLRGDDVYEILGGIVAGEHVIVE